MLYFNFYSEGVFQYLFWNVIVIFTYRIIIIIVLLTTVLCRPTKIMQTFCLNYTLNCNFNFYEKYLNCIFT